MQVWSDVCTSKEWCIFKLRGGVNNRKLKYAQIIGMSQFQNQKDDICMYRVFIKYCVFPENVVIFLNSDSSAAALVFYLPLCVHTFLIIILFHR